MIPTVNSRRGMTLAELMVSLALVAVMIVVVVSFVMLLTGHTRANGEHLAFQQDLTAVKAAVEGWVNRYDNEEVVPSVPDEHSEEWYNASALIALTAGSEQLDKLHFQNGILSAKELQLRADTIQAVAFRLERDGGDYLLFCKVTRANSDESYTFCINPRVGEMAGA